MPIDDEELDEKYRGIGVRIEDDVHITAKDPVVLSAGAPKTVENIEALMKEESFYPYLEKSQNAVT